MGALVTRRLVTLKEHRLADPQAEEVRRNRDAAIVELQDQAPQIIKGVELVEAVAKRVPHNLGRPPNMVIVSPIFLGSSTPGRIVEERAGVDRSKAIELYAFGFGSTVTVDVEVK